MNLDNSKREGKNFKIIVADDDSSVRETLVSALEKQGYNCKGIGTAREVLRHSWTTDRSVLLLNHTLGNITGLELLTSLSFLEKTPLTIVLLVECWRSNYGFEGSSARSLRFPG